MTMLPGLTRLLVLASIACTFACTVHASMPATVASSNGAASDAAASGEPLDLGVVIDFRRVGPGGLTVLAVTPGGLGERLGLQPGDRIVAANGESLLSTNRPSDRLANALSGTDGNLRLEIFRDGKPRTLAGPVDAIESRATVVQGCGHISSGGSHPRATRNIFPALVLSIDGDSKLRATSGYYRVEAGRRVLVVRELIDRDRFTEFGLEERERQRARYGGRIDKVLIVDVQPGTTYSIGAQTSRPIKTSSIRDNSYWEPVVWRNQAEPCR